MKIAPQYSGPVVHVLDASRAVAVVGALVGSEREAWLAQLRAEQEQLRAAHKAAGSARPLLSLARPAAGGCASTGHGDQPPRPEFLGVRAARRCRSHDLRPLIDWSPFFQAWELRGTYPRSSTPRVGGRRPASCSTTPRRMLDRMLADGLPQARAVYGFFPAGAVGDDIELYSDESRRHLLAAFPCCASRPT